MEVTTLPQRQNSFFRIILPPEAKSESSSKLCLHKMHKSLSIQIYQINIFTSDLEGNLGKAGRDGHFRISNPMEPVPFLGFSLIIEQNYANTCCA